MEKHKRQLLEVLKKFKCGMLVTQNNARKIHSRPMAIAEVTKEGEIFLITADDSGKLEEMRQHPEVNFTCQDSQEKFVSISGVAKIEADQKAIEELWNSGLQVWFPEGPEKSNAVIFRIEPHFGEYWDSSGIARAKYIFEAAKSYLTGTTPTLDEEQHAKVLL